MKRTIITGEDMDLAFRSGKTEFHISPRDIVTSVAKERAEKHGITLSMGSGSSTAGPSGVGFDATAVFQKSARASSADVSPPYDMGYWRKQFPLLSKYIHVANCSQSPQSTYTRDAFEEYMISWNEMGMDWERWVEEVELTKAEFAKIINADPSEIAMGTSVSGMTAAIASALPRHTARQKVVYTEAEFPTVGHVWKAHEKYGLKTGFIPVTNNMIDPAEYDRYVDEDTMLTSICDVYYYNGFRQKLSTIIPKIHDKGSLVYVDAYQGLGTHPLDVKALDVDLLASGNLKYLMGVPGIAFLYVKKEIAEYLEPAYTGWFGRKDPFAFDIHNVDYADGARRFDTGTPPIPTAYISRAGMKVINEVGVDNIHQWTNVLSQHCIDGALARGLDVVSPTDIRIKAPSTAIRVPGNSHQVEAELRKRNIIGSARADVVRIAPHFFTTTNDIDIVLDAFVDILKKL
ncbi:MAG: aminotransferase class V-fold PLP-dependent enzyme [Desulfobacteraceae bacterium]|nr:aminotransferase class V-fold PLP-dependent enzyme [Desulfobacteraceae bacterium]